MEPIIHFAIASTLGLSLRWSFLAGIIGVLPDLDVTLHVHRSISHSLAPTILIILLSLILWNKTKTRLTMYIVSLGWASHILLDLVGGYTPLLWPFYDRSIKLLMEVRLIMESSPSLRLFIGVEEQPYYLGAFKSLDAPILTVEGITLASLLVIIAVTLDLKRNNYKNS